MRFCIIKRHIGHKNTCICIEMYGVARSSCTIGCQITCLEFLRVPGSNACVQASIMFVMTEVYSRYEQIRGVKMDLWELVGLDQHLNGPIHGLFKNRMMGYSHVIVSINTVSR